MSLRLLAALPGQFSHRPARLQLRWFSRAPSRNATHRDAPTTSSLLTQALDQKQRANRSTESVGPFTFGLMQSPMAAEPTKKWSELSTTGKVMRTTARTTNFTVIILGAGFTAILAYALASELFSRNSPTVLFGEACDRIKTSTMIGQSLQTPLVFHNNPPSTTRPRHRNRHVSSQIALDASGREHLLLNFYVRGSRNTGAAIETDESWLEQQLNALSELTFDSTTLWIRTIYWDTIQGSKEVFHYLIGKPPPPRVPLPTIPSPPSDGGREVSVWTSFTGLFSGLRTSSKSKSPSALGAEAYDEGEVHADLVKDNSGNFVWRYILIDFPNSRSYRPKRVYIERAPDVREQESVLRWS